MAYVQSKYQMQAALSQQPLAMTPY